MNVNSLNPAQIQLLETFAGITSQEEMDELTKVIRDYYAHKLEEELEHLWDEGVLGQRQLDELKNEHLRTPYRQ